MYIVRNRVVAGVQQWSPEKGGGRNSVSRVWGQKNVVVGCGAPFQDMLAVL